MKFLRRMSLTTRFGILFCLVSIFIFTGVGTYLYRALSSELESRDDQELIGKIGLMQHIAEETESVASIQQDPHFFLDASANHDKLIVLLKDSQGSIVLHTNTDQGTLPQIYALPINESATRASIKSILTSTGLTARAISAKAKLRSGEQLKIIVARTTSDRMELLDAYRVEVWGAAISGTLLAALLGYLLVHQGLRPIRTIASKARSITVHRLDTHLDIDSAPQELHELVQAFNAMLDRLSSSFQRLNQFSADLAHDLRTPLNNLMVQTQVALTKARTTDDYQSLMISNIEEYERLAHMVESMLFLARAEHTQVTVNKKEINSVEQLQRIADYFEGVAEEAGVLITVSGSGSIYADAVLLRRAISNLMANAIRYTPIGGTISLRAEPILSGSIVSVTNPGVGIDEEHIPRLFDRFYRADTARSNSASSTGLGLAIVQSIMLLHSGKADATSKINELTCFTLTFPND
ncbi:heavy metal sensor histidine kinase [Herminiimonas arsenitoxidans]|uniref:heavy metal sensor histidine kinase n=1 Tax=Herminiimonas arsenitoxidans TaxID=1809410 RepID=UPI000970B1CE|nr:heavy metal sensor histidine kinase [Herminiimonas arsenitoxidans]